MYWASGAIHGPHHIMKEWADKYKGKFDDGWDKYRERVFARAKQKGWIPQNAQLTPRDPTMPSWDSIPEDEKPFQRRLMEVAAGFAEHVDTQVGRLVDELDRLGYGENTLIFYIWGDNGSSAEGQNGTIAEFLAQNAIPTTVPMHIQALEALGGLDVLGSPKVDNQYHAGWGWAGSTPYKGTKLVASHFGGTRNPMAVRWPAKIKPDATPRPQFHHVNDVVPTIYEVVGITPPREVNGVPQDPIDGVSLAYSFDDPNAAGRLLTQYFEVMGSRAIYHNGWMASAFGPRVPWLPGLPPGIREWTPDQDTWELYNLDKDWTQNNDLAATMPEKLAQLKELFAMEAARNKVLPIGGGLFIPVLHPEMRIAPPFTEWTFSGDITRVPEFCAPALGNKPNLVTITAEVPANANGVLYKLGFVCRWSHVLCRGRHPLLRVQPLHHPAHEDSRQGEAPGWQGDDRRRDGVRGIETCRSARRHASRSMASASLKGASRSAPRCSSAWIVSTSASRSDRRCRSTTTTRPRSNSTAGLNR